MKCNSIYNIYIMFFFPDCLVDILFLSGKINLPKITDLSFLCKWANLQNQQGSNNVFPTLTVMVHTVG